MFKPRELVGLGITAGVLYLLVSRDLVKLWQAGVERNEAALDTVNPASEGNIFYRWTTDLYRKLTGSDQSPGADLYDLLNPKPEAQAQPLPQPEAQADPDPEYIDSWRYF